MFISERDAAKLLGFSPKTLANDRSRGQLGIPFYRFGGAVRYDRDELLDWARQRRATSTTQYEAA